VEVLGKALTLFHTSVLGPGLGLEVQVLVNITATM